MPERIALTRLIIGGGKERRDVPAGSLVMLSDEDAAHLDARGAVQKPAEAEREARVAATARPSSDAERVATPAAGTPGFREVDGDDNVTRGAPAGEIEEL